MASTGAVNAAEGSSDGRKAAGAWTTTAASEAVICGNGVATPRVRRRSDMDPVAGMRTVRVIPGSAVTLSTGSESSRTVGVVTRTVKTVLCPAVPVIVTLAYWND